MISCLWLLSPVLYPDARAAEKPAAQFAEQRDAAVQLYGARKYFQAIQALESALKVASGAEKVEAETLLARCRSAIGVEFFNAGENRQAEEAFHASLAHAEDSYAHFGLGYLHYLRLEDEKSLSHLKEAARLDPSFGKAHKLLALLEYRQGHLAPAISKIKEAFRLDSQDREARVLRDRWELESQWTGTFKERESGRFFLRVDPGITSSRTDEVVEELERARKDMVEAFCLNEPQRRGKTGEARERSRIVIVLFSPDRFHKATGSFHWVGGLYDGQIKFPVRPERGDARAQADLVAAIRHEVAHWAIREIGPECPNWLNEGLAQFFEGEGRPEQTRERLRTKGVERISFKDVPARLWEVDNEALAQMTYLEGLGFVEFLAARYKPFRFPICLRAMKTEGSLARAFELTYGMTIDELEREWWKSIDAEKQAGKK